MATRKYSNKRKRRVNRFDLGGIPQFNSMDFMGTGPSLQGATSDAPIWTTSLDPNDPAGSLNQIKSEIDGTAGVAKSGLSSAAKGLIGAGASILGTAGGKLISGGLESGAGNAITGLGSSVGGAISAVNPLVGGIVTGASGLVGGITNALFGSKLNQERINDIESGIDQLNSLQVDDSSTNSILDQFGNTTFGQSFSKKDIGSDGLFSNKASKTYKRLKKEQALAINTALGNFSNAAGNVQENQVLDSMANYAAYGGPITMRYTGPMSPFGNTFDLGGAISNGLEFLKKPSLGSFLGGIGNLVDFNLNTGMNLMKDGGKIHIKPENRGKFTALKKRTGKSATWFKEHGTPAQKKMAIFALNSKKWRHNNGGFLNDNIPDNYDSLYPSVLQVPKQWIGGRNEKGNNRPTTSSSNNISKNSEDVSNLLLDGLNILHNMDYNNRASNNGYSYNVNGISNNMGLHNMGGSNDYTTGLVFRDENFLENMGKNNKKAKGGFLNNTHGGIFSNGVTTINEGGSHETNPFEGIQLGVDNQGIPNLVEEGEVIFNDYVYSNRIKAPKEVKKKYKLRGETFADLAENAQKESEERPNDPISQRGLQDIMAKLAMEQESIREKKANRSRKYAHGGKLGNWYDGTGDWNQWLAKYKKYTGPDYYQDITTGYPDKPYDWMARNKYYTRFPNSGWGLDDNGSIIYNAKHDPYLANIHNKSKVEYPSEIGSYDSTPATTTRGNGRTNNTARRGGAAAQRPAVGDYSYGANTLNLDRNINTADLYKQGSEYMRARQYVLDNWDTPYVQNWLKDYYVPFVTKYNRSRGYRGNFTVNRDQFEKGTYDSNFGGMHQGLINFQYPGKNGVPKFDATAFGDYGLSPSSNANEGPIWQRGLANPTAAELGDIANEMTGLNSAFGSAKPSTRTSVENDNGNSDDNKANPLTYLRYAPILGNAIALTQSLLSKPDYSNADAVLEAARDAGRYMPIGYKPIGNYLTYTPFDRDYYVNKLAAQAGATRRAITGQSAGNRATAMAGLLAADYNAQNNLGNLARQAAEYNFANRQAVETFNRGTNQANSEMALKAAMANQDAYARSAASRLSGTAQAMAMRQAIDDARNAGIAANFGNIFQTLGDIGREEVERSWVEKLPALYYDTSTTGRGINYKGKDNSKSYGGYITRKNKKKGGKK